MDNWVYFVEDATGDPFLFTVAGKDYAPAFRKHARWWLRTGWKQTARKRGMATAPAFPCKVRYMPSEQWARDHAV